MASTLPMPSVCSAAAVLPQQVARSAAEQASLSPSPQVAPVSWIEPDAWRQLERSLPINSSYVSQAAWLKLFIPQLLPALPGVDRVVYMDCDMLTLESLAPLWDVPLQGDCAAQRSAVYHTTIPANAHAPR